MLKRELGSLEHLDGDVAASGCYYSILFLLVSP